MRYESLLTSIHIWHETSHRANIDDGAFGLNQKRV